jgi:hypothetical protein
MITKTGDLNQTTNQSFDSFGFLGWICCTIVLQAASDLSLLIEKPTSEDAEHLRKL